MSTVLEDRTAGVIHSMIYWGFLVLFAGTVTLEIDHLVPNNVKFLEGGFYQGYSLVLDAAAVVFVVGVALAALRRWVFPPVRIRTKTKPEDAVTLLVLGLIGITPTWCRRGPPRSPTRCCGSPMRCRLRRSSWCSR
jgi:nitrate reductase gamma subunit